MKAQAILNIVAVEIIFLKDKPILFQTTGPSSIIFRTMGRIQPSLVEK
jgi:hypothetical protein